MANRFFKVKHRGSFRNSEKFFNRALKREYLEVLEKYGELGVDLLRNATPVDTGATADAWSYKIEPGDGKTRLVWYNSNNNQWANVALMIIYGHGLQNGSYVEGLDFVTPALHPMFIQLSNRVWKEVTK